MGDWIVKRGSALAEPDIPVGDISAWMVEAGRPFLDWLLGDVADATIREWIGRDSSEFSLRHATVVIEDGRCIAGISVLSGAALARARLSDMQALLRGADQRDGEAVVSRLRASRNWFLPVPAEDFYVSKVGVAHRHRGRGLGKMLMRDAIARGKQQGFRTLRLDVSAANEPAISLYRALGFETIGQTYIEELLTSYLAMRLEQTEG